MRHLTRVLLRPALVALTLLCIVSFGPETTSGQGTGGHGDGIRTDFTDCHIGEIPGDPDDPMSLSLPGLDVMGEPPSTCKPTGSRMTADLGHSWWLLASAGDEGGGLRVAARQMARVLQTVRYGSRSYLQGAGWLTTDQLDYLRWGSWPPKPGWFSKYCAVVGPGLAQMFSGPAMEIDVASNNPPPTLATVLRLENESACNLDPKRCSGGNPNVTEWVWECGWDRHQPWVTSAMSPLTPLHSDDPPEILRLDHGFQSDDTRDGNDALTQFRNHAYFVAPLYLGGPYYNETSEIFWGNNDYGEHDGQRVQIFYPIQGHPKPLDQYRWQVCMGNVEPCTNGQEPRPGCSKPPGHGNIRITRVEPDTNYKCVNCEVKLWAETNCRPFWWTVVSDSAGLVKQTGLPNANPFVIELDETKLRTQPYSGEAGNAIVVKIYDVVAPNYWDAEVVRVWRDAQGVHHLQVCEIEVAGIVIRRINDLTPAECDFFQNNLRCGWAVQDLPAEVDRLRQQYFPDYCGDPGVMNAFRHAYISCIAAQRCGGAQNSKELWEAHEEYEGNACEQASMDLHNNKAGRRNVQGCTINCPSCVDKVMDDLEAGRLRWSNEHVQYYQSGQPVPPLEQCPNWENELADGDPCTPNYP